jgi:hypothetical protein
VETGVVNKILNETHTLGCRSFVLNFFEKFKMFTDVRFLSFFTKRKY